METYCNEYSIILEIWIVLSYFVFSFLSFFLPLSKEVDYSAEDKFISSNSVTSINKATLKIKSYIPYQPNLFFLSNSSHILLTEIQTP